MNSFAVILPAAGSANRFGSNKLTEKLAGTAVISHSLRAFTRRDDVSHIIVPTNDFAAISEALGESSTILPDKRVEFCPGGSCRAESVLRGLRQIPETVEWVAIHDAARPLVSQNLIDKVWKIAQEKGAAAASLPVTLTIKQATAPLPSRVLRTLNRAELFAMQTPQIARRSALIGALESSQVPLDQLTDDMQALELSGLEVWLVAGEERNLKVTTPMDLKIAETLL